MSWGAAAVPTAASNATDVECAQGPSETISSIAWSPQQLMAQGKNLLVAGSWDKTVRVWDVQKSMQGTVQGMPRASTTNDQPVFDVALSADGVVYFGGGCQTVKMMNLAQAGSPPQQVASHDLPIKCIRFSNETRRCITAGWDGLVKIWDCKTPNPVQTFNLGAPAVAMDLLAEMCTVATATTITVYNLATMQVMKQTKPHTAVREQLRCVANFPDKAGFAAGSIEGRTCVMHVHPSQGSQDFSFKAHRENTKDIFSVNSISFHPVYGTFATAGSNGGINIWDKEHRNKVKTFQNTGNTISCASFDASGDVYAYARSYDWTKGAAQYNAALGHKLMLKVITAQLAQKKKK
eukprot:TRINITY_DN15864_c0_g1_i1.p1 TRINITY_DN15864_c0_g1~~TRINITY_DN15864_c0_g1_i1.p1  ORF type:complete len:350 (+),score=59.27 TRINITY_DN15864_c0_g1_i1:53-1102(+)